MAINQVLQPGSTTPTNNNDYTYQNNNIDVGLIPKLSIFNNWEDTTIEPVIAQGTFLYMGGLIYECQGSNEAIAGVPASGINYIVATVTGTVMTLAWSTSKSGYLYNPVYAGNYSGSTQILLDICYKDGTAFRRARSLGMDLNNFYLANGSIWFSGGLNTNGNDINMGGGGLNTQGGAITTSGQAITVGSVGCTSIASTSITNSGTLLSSGLVSTDSYFYGEKYVNIISWSAGATLGSIYTQMTALLTVSLRKVMASGSHGANNVYAVERVSATSIDIYERSSTSLATISVSDGSPTTTATSGAFSI